MPLRLTIPAAANSYRIPFVDAYIVVRPTEWHNRHGENELTLVLEAWPSLAAKQAGGLPIAGEAVTGKLLDIVPVGTVFEVQALIDACEDYVLTLPRYSTAVKI